MLMARAKLPSYQEQKESLIHGRYLMDEKPVTPETHRKYSDLWNYNLQKLEEIQKDIEINIQELEKKYSNFQGIYEHLCAQLDLLSSIYSSFNPMFGGEYVMKLKSVIENYRKRYTLEGIDFDLIHFLLMKITDLRTGSFEQFPELAHLEEYASKKKEKDAFPMGYQMRPYKWITFERNRSWFIISYKVIDIRDGKDGTIISHEEPDMLTIRIDGKKLKVKDIFSTFGEISEEPRYFLFTDRARKNYAASRIGKKVYSRRDIITPGIKPFSPGSYSTISPGRIRIFGRNHIVLS